VIGRSGSSAARAIAAARMRALVRTLQEQTIIPAQMAPEPARSNGSIAAGERGQIEA
jgi:hypothetical protein